ncbi:PQQ-dependent sugar dehydrogenase [Nitrosomonas ureae]|uniref:Glucose/arabinose dehydrogenase, beta-propeller fold n=1 Tax=Nitrosomonas ureae TaxID=44577 RepID=A0A286AC62_9PROT|nr:PQQ-dependent sugar dehydrogenase [Nitrosomonas ureae]SOD19492.1 Glucose/arabinose dehydrogenase, beta-propeller fold [Nitrosomonas ureae]
MKFLYPLLTLLLLGTALDGLAINTDQNTAETSVNSAGERIDNPIPDPIQKGSIRLRLKQIATGLTAPNWAVPIPGATEHLYVSDQDRKLWRIDLATNKKEILIDLFSSNQVPLGAFGDESYDERGFLGFAFHPQYIDNGLFYTYDSENAINASDFSTIPPSATADHRSVITEWRFVSPSLNDPPAAIERVRDLLTIDQPQFNHNGGALNFGPDGMLYIALGDGGGADDRDGQNSMIGHGVDGNGQNPGNPLGSLLRINPLGNNSSNGKYGIPADNPFVGSSTMLSETYAYGFRNPFRFSFDSQTGALVLADVGQNDIEEVNLIQPGGNYGWGLKEGSFRFEPNGNDPGFVTDGTVAGNFIDPVIQYDHDEGIAIIGGFVYRGNAIPALQGKYVFGDTARTGNADGRIFYSDGSEILELDLADRDQPGFWILGFGQDGDGELYVLGNTTGTPFGTTGAVYKLVPNANFEGNLLEIPAVNVTLTSGENMIYHARLQHLSGSDPMRFELIDAEILADRFRDDSATFDQPTGKLNLSFINVADSNGQIFTYSVELQQVPEQSNLTFELKQFERIK